MKCVNKILASIGCLGAIIEIFTNFRFQDEIWGIHKIANIEIQIWVRRQLGTRVIAYTKIVEFSPNNILQNLCLTKFENIGEMEIMSSSEIFDD